MIISGRFGAMKEVKLQAVKALSTVATLAIAAIILYTARIPCARASSNTIHAMDPDGFDPVADTVGAGIYGGRMLRNSDGTIVIGQQYTMHNKAPGPVYAGTGYTDMANAIHEGPDAVRAYLASGSADPNETMTGGASPLHTCGMSKTGQLSTQLLIDAGADIEAADTYGYTPLHRMASNNLAIGAEALLTAGADVNKASGKPYAGDTPLRIALQSGAKDVAAVLKRYGGRA